jgi:hypothetical protein
VDIEVWVSIGAVVVSIGVLVVALGALAVAAVALYFTRMAARATEVTARATGVTARATEVAARATEAQAGAVTEQTELQRQMHRDAAQPYVWVDIRPDSKQPDLLILVVGNSGHTVAKNVRATFDPSLTSLKTGAQRRAAESASRALREGIPSLSPGRQIVWVLGSGHEVLGTETVLRFTITVDADGPSDRLPQLRYEVDIHAYRESHDAPDGSLHLVRKAIEQVATVIARESPGRAGL